MADVQRWMLDTGDCECDCGMYTEDDGGWVRWDDYEALRSQVAALTKERDAATAEAKQLREERELVKRWLLNLPDEADLDRAREMAAEVAGRIEELDRAVGLRAKEVDRG